MIPSHRLTTWSSGLFRSRSDVLELTAQTSAWPVTYWCCFWTITKNISFLRVLVYTVHQSHFATMRYWCFTYLLRERPKWTCQDWKLINTKRWRKLNNVHDVLTRKSPKTTIPRSGAVNPHRNIIPKWWVIMLYLQWWVTEFDQQLVLEINEKPQLGIRIRLIKELRDSNPSRQIITP